MNVKKEKPPDKSLDYFKCVKVPLKHILKNLCYGPKGSGLEKSGR